MLGLLIMAIAESTPCSALPSEFAICNSDVRNCEQFNMPAKGAVCAGGKVIEVYMVSAGVVDIPLWIYDLNTVEKLVLSNNGILGLTSRVRGLTKLRSLEIQRNELRSLPKQLATLPDLQFVDVRFNPFTCVPPELALARVPFSVIFSPAQEDAFQRAGAGEACAPYATASPTPAPTPTPTEPAEPAQAAMFFPTSKKILVTSGKSLANFERPVLGCIDAKICK